MEENAVIYEKREKVGVITFNRPHRLNAINEALLKGFIHQLLTAQKDPGVQSVIVTGAGRAFCAGEDLKETSSGKSFKQWTIEVDALQDVQRVILGLGKPLIAAINGYAVGGGLEFALSCDIRIAAEGATFGFPETSVGLTVTTAGTKLITQIVGLGKAKELILTGRFVDAKEALDIGLVNQVVTAEALLDQAMDMCRSINKRSSLAVKLSRIAIDQGMHASFEQILELEASHLLTCINSNEQQALVEKKLKTMQAGKVE
ncbi:enoyl-CoA hydratase/isomerase family protein [uncultured Desulfosarcina sp.]|uniref:enoyl-CoA hydratase/isomerase family protein n=1 Tax=uncultured Desulfosarcina sp. TaxID=218289 RepID=UPI0029C7A58A|nr:enoyl-CoA hydratase/isomerase family protein [uncultured Desulfosarcina sp.]